MKVLRWDINRCFGILYWFVSLLIFAFVAKDDEKIIGELLIFHIPLTKWLIHLLFFVAFCLVFIVLKKKIVIDAIEISLAIKLFVDILSTCFLNTPESYAFIVWADIGVLAYFVSRNITINLDTVLSIYEVFALILGIQTILSGLLLLQKGVSFDSVVFKSQLRIPFAGSNLIAGTISSAFLCVIARYKRSNAKYFLMIAKLVIYLLAILFIRSRGSIVLLLFILDWTLIKTIKRVNDKVKRFILYSALFVGNIAGIVFMLKSTVVANYFSRYIEASNDVTSGRLDIWQYAWGEFIRHPLFGRGISFESHVITNYTGAHNIWLDTLMSSGVMGYLLHLLALLFMIRKIRLYQKRQQRKKRALFACMIALGFLYMNSMIEVTYYNYINDLIFWSLSGFLLSEMEKNTKTIECISILS